MPHLKQLSGKEVIKILEMHGFLVKRTKGSHARLSRKSEDGSYHITVPLHDQLKKGTLSGIAKECESILGKEITAKYFYTE